MRSAGGPRQSLDANRVLGGGVAGGPMSPRVGGGMGMRPNSEMLGVGGQPGFGVSPESEAIDKWFEDLQSYEATLEEMAAASLDANFKEELGAIEQWFRVLSEAERTAALYSLLQSSTQVQIRFFITVLQQMARSDPMSALISPGGGGGQTPSMEQQMEAKLAQLSTKSPASPVVRQFARQSLNAAHQEAFLSPNAAALHSSTSASNDTSNSDAAAALLASQRAKLKANAANRVSAPGQLLGDSGLKSPKWGASGSGIAEESNTDRISRSPSPRPKSTGAELAGGNNASSAASQVAFARAAAAVGGMGGMESQLSPILGGSWASQVNTPLVPMFERKDEDAAVSQGLGDAAGKLAEWGAAHRASGQGQQPPGPQPGDDGIQLDDARKFRRQSKVGGVGGFSGVLSGMGSSTNGQNAGGSQPGQQQRSGATLQPPRSGVPPQMGGTSPMTSQAALLGAQQAAMNAQANWRSGLASPGVGAMPSPGDPQAMANNLAMMNMMNNMNMNDPNALQNMASLLQMQQQMQQMQQLQAFQQMQGGMLGANMNLMGGANPMLSPVSARLGMGFPTGMPMMGAGMAAKRSPGGRSPIGKPTHTPGSGSNPDEELDMKLLSDIPAWLRGLRLHKYTPNFEGCKWQDMVLMDDAALESRGVAAVGARRKMLRTFETVRIKKGMALPGDGEEKPGDEKPTETSVSPATESDKELNKA